jgi:hypothetical protein
VEPALPADPGWVEEEPPADRCPPPADWLPDPLLPELPLPDWPLDPLLPD